MKPTVHFIRESFMPTTYHNSASVIALDHPRLGYGRIISSSVVEMREDGSFETLNTFYVPVEEKDMNNYRKD